MSVAVDAATGVVYVSCSTSPSASVWTVDPSTGASTRLVDFPDGPDASSVAVRSGVGLCAVSRAYSGLSLCSLSGEGAVTKPVAYVLRDINSNPALGHVYAAYAGAVPYPAGEPAGVVNVWNSSTLEKVSAFPCIAPASITTWIGGSELIMGGADGYLGRYSVSGDLVASYHPTQGTVAWLGSCVAEMQPIVNSPLALFQDIWGNSGKIINLVTGSIGGISAGASWLGYWEGDQRLFGDGSSRLAVSAPGSTSLYDQTSTSCLARPSKPGSDGLIYTAGITSTTPRQRCIFGYTAAGGPTVNSSVLSLCAQAVVNDKNPIAVARNEKTGRVYVTNYKDGTVAVFDGALTRLSTIYVGGHPFRIWVDEITSRVFVGDCGTSKVSVIEDIADIPTLTVAEAASTPEGIVAGVQGGVVKSLPLSQGKTGYLWYYFDVETEDHSATITVWRKSLPNVQIGSRVDMVGTIETIKAGSTARKSIVARELTIH
jgi:YVTN family beta-propeller protein